MNIRKKIGLSMTMLAIIIVAFVGIFSNIIARDTLKDRGKDFLISILNRTSFEINLQINTMEKVVESVYDDFALTYNFIKGSNDVDYLEKYLHKFEGTIKLAAELSPSKSAFLILSHGDHEYTIWYRDYNNDGIPERYLETKQFNFSDQVIENQIQWVHTHANAKDISSIKVIQQNETTVIIGTDLNYYLMKSKFDNSKYLDSGILFLLGSDGEVIYHPDKISESNIDLSTFSFDTSETIEQKNEAGVSVICSKSMLNNNWHLIISAETSDIFLGLNQLNYIIVIILIFATFIALIYSIIVSKYIANPYLYLTHKIEEIGNGNYDIEFSDKYLNLEDEVGTFTRAMQTTVIRQKNSFEKINDYNMNLENIIAERTKELIATNNALEESVITTEEKQERLVVINQQLEASIDEIKKTRKKLIKSEKIASSRYLAIGIAHNLNTPIGNAKSIASFIKNHSEKMITTFRDNLMTKKHLNEFLLETNEGSQIILDSIEASIQLVEKMKMLSLIETLGILSLINVKETIEAQVKNSKKEHEDDLCSFSILVDENLEFQCDLYSFQKIFNELIENSYTHAFALLDDPHITIKAYKNTESNNGIIVEYFDNGIGVDSKTSRELFTPLYTTKLSSRHGLGLTMIHNLIIEGFDGEITIVTDKTKGLSYNIKLFDISEERD
jgi:C4-dicarboxylate-specific signal transduction histidine kinase